MVLFSQLQVVETQYGNINLVLIAGEISESEIIIHPKRKPSISMSYDDSIEHNEPLEEFSITFQLGISSTKIIL